MNEEQALKVAALLDKRFTELEDRVAALEAEIQKPPEDPWAGFERHRKSRQRGDNGAVQSGRN